MGLKVVENGVITKVFISELTKILRIKGYLN